MAQTILDRQDAAERRFEEYLEAIGSVLGHADRRAPMHAYCTGLLLPGSRKSVEPMAARVAPQRVQAAHQSLHHFVAKAEWSDGAMLDMVRERVLPVMERHGPIRHWIIDDTGVPKKGKLSVGVARQYCGQIGKQDNCQVAVTLSVANEQASLPIAYRLYLPQTWADDPERRRTAGVPAAIGFATKPQIALGQVRAALAKGVPRGLVLSDAGYGIDTDFRTELTALGLRYVVGVQSSLSLWPPGQEPLPAKPWSGVGRPPKLRRRDAEHKPVSALELAKSLSVQAWRTITWREGTNAPLASRFAAVRVRPAHRDYWRSEPHAEEWLLIEWPKGEKEPTKYWCQCRLDTPRKGRLKIPQANATAGLRGVRPGALRPLVAHDHPPRRREGAGGQTWGTRHDSRSRPRGPVGVGDRTPHRPGSQDHPQIHRPRTGGARLHRPASSADAAHTLRALSARTPTGLS